MPNLNIRFPVLRQIIVKGYGLFPGKDNNGIDHTFEPGVTVIPGINGIGKTTLLNIIYRLIVGPYDPYKEDDGIQLTQTRLKRLDHFDYFSNRDKGPSISALAIGVFGFGERELSVTRSLSDLSLLRVAIDGESRPINQEDPESWIWGLSGCGSQYDFHLLIRSLIFFMEQKASVVWDQIAQAEIFRILFLSAEEAKRVAKLAYDIQRLDSQRRNAVYALNRNENRLAKLRVQSSVTVDVVQRVEQVARKIEVTRNRLVVLEENTDSLERALRNEKQRLDAYKMDLEEATRALDHLHHEYFASLFPGVTETAKNVFLNLVSDNGCLACGSRKPGLSLQFRALSEQGACPVCRSDKEFHERTLGQGQLDSQDIQQQLNRVNSLKTSVSELETAVNEKGQEYQRTLRERFELQAEGESLRLAEHQLRGLLPGSAENVREAQSSVSLATREIGDLKGEITDNLAQYESMLVGFRQEIDLLRENLTAYFGEYAGSFLAEKCNLTFSPQKLLLGQGVEKVEFPLFAVQMTSAVSPSAGTTRTSINDVSESQKEFIDLAFRMAVLKAHAMATDAACQAMIVIETPEASLDSVFIGNAGRMLRAWCEPSISGTNSIVATSNLNRENMISALLGLRPEDAPYPPDDEIKRRVLNLMEIAAENAALRAHRGHYQEEFRKSTTPGGANV
jgi:hypothetical protein